MLYPSIVVNVMKVHAVFEECNKVILRIWIRTMFFTVRIQADKAYLIIKIELYNLFLIKLSLVKSISVI